MVLLLLLMIVVVVVAAEDDDADVDDAVEFPPKCCSISFSC